MNMSVRMTGTLDEILEVLRPRFGLLMTYDAPRTRPSTTPYMMAPYRNPGVAFFITKSACGKLVSSNRAYQVLSEADSVTLALQRHNPLPLADDLAQDGHFRLFLRTLT